GRERGLRSLGDSIGKPSAIFRAHTRILRRTFVNNMHVWCRFVAVWCQVTHPHCAMVRWFCRRRIIFGSAQIAGQFARQLGDMTNVGARTPAGCCTGPELRTPGAAPQTRMVSVARIRLGSWESARAFKGIICDRLCGPSPLANICVGGGLLGWSDCLSASVRESPKFLKRDSQSALRARDQRLCVSHYTPSVGRRV